MKYELTDETIVVFERTLHRVRYCADGALGGWIEFEDNLDQDGDAQVYGDAWEKSPLQIQGAKFFFSVSSKTHITVGCTSLTVAKWLEVYEEMFNRHEFTREEQAEYIAYFNLAAQLYGWEERIPVKEE